MEYLDVLDDQGNPTGVRKLRQEVHRDGDWHATVHVWLVNSSGQVLLQKRSANIEVYPGLWAPTASGHVVAGQTLEEAALRELEEELGIVVSLNQLKRVFVEKKNHGPNNNQFDNVFVIEADLDMRTIKMQEEEVEKVAWWPKDEVFMKLKSGDLEFVPRSQEYQEKLFAAIEELLAS